MTRALPCDGVTGGQEREEREAGPVPAPLPRARPAHRYPRTPGESPALRQDRLGPNILTSIARYQAATHTHTHSDSDHGHS